MNTSASNNEMVQKALRLACIGHEGQYRFDKITPFVYHCICVMQNTAEDIVTPSALATALLHDLLEDTKLTLEGFPTDVRVYVQALTAHGDSPTRKMDALKALELVKSPIPVIVKMADRRHNLEDDPKKVKWSKYEESTYWLLEMAKERGLDSTVNFYELRNLYLNRCRV